MSLDGNNGNGSTDWLTALRGWAKAAQSTMLTPQPRIGVALGGGFARGIAHVGVLRVLERHQIPIHAIAGVSAGAIVASAFASGTTADEIGQIGGSMRFTDVANWRLSRVGLVASERMDVFLKRLLKCFHFEQMKIPFGVVATDLATGEPVFFQGKGDVVMPIRASCSYPGLFHPIRLDGRVLVDGAMSMEIPALLLRRMGCTRVISVHLPMQRQPSFSPANMFQVINRCFQIMQARTERDWRRLSDLVITPDVSGMEWDSFRSAEKLIETGEKAAMDALPRIQAWISRPRRAKDSRRPAASEPTPLSSAVPQLSSVEASTRRLQ